MNSNRAFDAAEYFLPITLSTVFIAIATFIVFSAVGSFAFNSNMSNYFFLGIGYLILTVSCVLLLMLPKYKILNVAIIASFIIFSVGIFLKKDEIKDWFVDMHYSKVNESMLRLNENIVDTSIYKQFLADRNNRDIVRLKEYQDHSKQYTSINTEQLMNLKLFYGSIKNNSLKIKIDDMFKDNIVTQSEYGDFQKFIANQSMDSQELALLSIVAK